MTSIDPSNESLGIIVQASLSQGVEIRLSNKGLAVVTAGSLVCFDSHTDRFIGLITDIRLLARSDALLALQPTKDEWLWSRISAQRFEPTHAQVQLLIAIDANNRLMPVTRVPHAHAPIRAISEQERFAIFQGPDAIDADMFTIGYLQGLQSLSVSLHLPTFFERSNGIFGTTGTGKTFITRLILAGMLQQSNHTALIFDMHSEYALQARAEGQKKFVKGLKALFPHKIAIGSTDPVSTRARGASPDITISIAYEHIEVEDVISLQQELALHPTACEAAYLLAMRYKRQWLTTLLHADNTMKELAASCGAHIESLTALHRKLRVLQRLSFIHDGSQSNYDSVQEIVSFLQRGISVIIEFGTHTSTTGYLLLANMLTRRIHQAYIQQTEQFLATGNSAFEPRKLMIVIEEAHKFLNPAAAAQTIFGIIAREMRKYYVSLLIIDQRPSGIDEEVLSQLGTKFVAKLQHEKDIAAVLTGTPHAQQWRQVLAGLTAKGQMLAFGHALPVPMVVTTRRYDEQFYKDMRIESKITNTENIVSDLY